MKNKWILVTGIILFTSLIGGATILAHQEELSSTFQEVNAQFVKITKPFSKLSLLNKKLSKIDGIKILGLKLGTTYGSDEKTNYITVVVTLKKGYRLKNAAKDIVRVIIKNYPKYRNRDLITIIEGKEINAGSFYYSQDIDEISKSPQEWEEALK